MASSRVFDITELLQYILVEVPMRDLLTNAQRVCQRWKRVIDHFPALQQALFQQAKPASFVGDSYIQNPLLAGLLEDFFRVKGLSSSSTSRVSSLDMSIYPENFWFTRLRDSAGQPKPAQLTSRVENAINLTEYDWDRDCFDFEFVWNVKNASWRNMQIAQPPITQVRWEVCRNEGDNKTVDFHKRFPVMIVEFDFPDGITMGDYYDLVRGTRGSHRIKWPQPGPFPSALPLEDGTILYSVWRNVLIDAANMGRVLTIFQKAWGLSYGLDDFWKGADLKKYFRNIIRIHQRRIVNATRVKYVYQQPSTSVMEQFLLAATIPKIDSVTLTTKIFDYPAVVAVPSQSDE
ncbi:hypothetical protein GGR53DRAFT_526781 [Hypoxylon sp. FL1150]|nr:hypothetical protein GGR53DRAFT_526781 [Hypoxylon sp. FL1150]